MSVEGRVEFQSLRMAHVALYKFLVFKITAGKTELILFPNLLLLKEGDATELDNAYRSYIVNPFTVEVSRSLRIKVYALPPAKTFTPRDL